MEAGESDDPEQYTLRINVETESMVDTEPDPPMGLTATPDAVIAEIELDWTLGSDGGSLLLSHEIERKLASQDDTFYANVGSVGGSAITFTDTAGNGLVLSESYDYRVFATNAIGLVYSVLDIKLTI